METQQPKQNILKDMENFFNTYLHQKAPFHLPASAKRWLVKYGPWLDLLIIVLAIPSMLTYFSLAHSYLLSLGGAVLLIALLLQAAALPGLFTRKITSWRLLYYAVLVSALGQLLGGQFVNFIFNLIISMYFLFEIKEYYI